MRGSSKVLIRDRIMAVIGKCAFVACLPRRKSRKAHLTAVSPGECCQLIGKCTIQLNCLVT
jgi:hypothetical protein